MCSRLSLELHRPFTFHLCVSYANWGESAGFHGAPTIVWAVLNCLRLCVSFCVLTNFSFNVLNVCAAHSLDAFLLISVLYCAVFQGYFWASTCPHDATLSFRKPPATFLDSRSSILISCVGSASVAALGPFTFHQCLTVPAWAISLLIILLWIHSN